MAKMRLPVKGLDRLLAALRTEGISITPQQVEKLQHVIALRADWDAKRLGDVMRSLFVRGEDEEAAFWRIYAAWTSQTPGDKRGTGDAAALGPLALSGRSALRGSRQLQDSRPFWIRMAFLFTITSAIVLSLPFIPRGDPPPEEPMTDVSATPPLTAEAQPSRSADTWIHVLSLAAIVIVGVVYGIRYRVIRAKPRPLASTDPDGPRELPLLPLPMVSGDLVDSGEMRSTVWEVGRFVSDDLTRQVDLDRTVTATAREAGFPTVHLRRAVYPREVWFWRDRCAEDPATDRLVEQVRRRLERAGLPVRFAEFWGVPDKLIWSDGASFDPLTVEGHRQHAVVAILTDGAGIEGSDESARERLNLRLLLRHFVDWPHLRFFDLGVPARLAATIGRFGLRVAPPLDLCAFLREAESPRESGAAYQILSGDLRVLAAALTLTDEAVNEPTAFALARALDVHLDITGYRHLMRALGGCNLSIGPMQRAELVNWLVRAERLRWDRPVPPESSLGRAIKFWRERYARERLEREKREGGIAAWAGSRAEQGLRLREALLDLWSDQDRAVVELQQLMRAGWRSEIRRKLRYLAPMTEPSQAAPSTGETPVVINLPWYEKGRDDAQRAVLARLGLSGLTARAVTGIVRAPGSLGLAYGLLIGLAALVLWRLLVR
ncbi:MAG: hypothetical protein GY725_24905 [bacterium]|nr:hypothetical protein [bacterium]